MEFFSVSATETSSLTLWLTEASSAQVDGRKGEGAGEGSSGLVLTSSSSSNSDLYRSTLQSMDLAGSCASTAVL